MVAFFVGLLLGGGVVGGIAYYGCKRFARETAEPDLLQQLREENQALTEEMDGLIEARNKAVEKLGQVTKQLDDHLEQEAIRVSSEHPGDIGMTYISEDEYNELAEGDEYETEAIEYYPVDGAFVDSVGEVVTNPGDLFGDDIYHNIKENDAIYIQDHNKHLAYEIIVEKGLSYTEDFLGIPSVNEEEDD